MMGAEHIEHINIVPSIIIGIGSTGSKVAHKVRKLINKNLADASVLLNCVSIDAPKPNTSPTQELNDKGFMNIKLEINDKNILDNRNAIHQALQENLNTIWHELYKLIGESSFVGNLDSVRSKGYTILNEEFNIVLIGDADDIFTQSTFITLSYFISDKLKNEQGIAGIKKIGFLSMRSIKNTDLSSEVKNLSKNNSVKNNVRKLTFLRELNHFMSGNEFQFNKDYFYIKTHNRVFDILFVLENVNQNNELLAQSEEEYFEILSNAVFYNILNADKNRSRILSTITKYGKRSAVYSTLGLASYNCPINELSELYSYRLSSELLSKMLQDEADTNNTQVINVDNVNVRNLYNKLSGTFDEKIKKHLLLVALHSFSLKKVLSYKPLDVPGVDELVRSIKKSIEKNFGEFTERVYSESNEILNKTPDKINELISALSARLRNISKSRDILAELEAKETAKINNFKEKRATLNKILSASETIFPPIGWLILMIITIFLLLIASFKTINVLQSYNYLFLDILLLIGFLGWSYYIYILSVKAEDDIKRDVIYKFINDIVDPWVRIKTITYLNEQLSGLREKLVSQKNILENLKMHIQAVKEDFEKKKKEKEDFLNQNSFTLTIRNIYPYGDLYEAYNRIIADREREWVVFTKEFDIGALTQMETKDMFKKIYNYTQKKFIKLNELCSIENIMKQQSEEIEQPLISISELETKSAVWSKYSTTAPGGKITPEILKYLYTHSVSSSAAKDFKINAYGNRYIIATGNKFAIGISTIHHGLPLFAFNTVNKLIEMVRKFGKNVETVTIFNDEKHLEPIEAVTISKEMEDTIQNFLLALITNDIFLKNNTYTLKYKRKNISLGVSWKDSISFIRSDKNLSNYLEERIGKNLVTIDEKTLYDSLTKLLEDNKEQLDSTINTVAASLISSIGND